MQYQVAKNNYKRQARTLSCRISAHVAPNRVEPMDTRAITSPHKPSVKLILLQLATNDKDALAGGGFGGDFRETGDV